STAPVPLAYEPPTPVTRAPLPPPAGYAPAPTTSSLSNTDAGEAARLGWHASPRWAAIKGNDVLVEPDDQRAKFKAAKAKASKVGVDSLPEHKTKEYAET